jgi:secreted trypsin-like serine protease
MKRWFFALISVCAGGVVGCGGGDGDSSSLSRNACGDIGLPTKMAQLKIINGTACAALDQSPVVRVILVDQRGREAGCTGTMISADDVMTAAHCFMVKPKAVYVIYGDAPDDLVSVRVSSWSVHPGFGGTGPALHDDVAVLHLPAALPLPVLPILASVPPQVGDIAAIFGYGKNEAGDTSFEELRSGEMRIAEVMEEDVRADYNGDGTDTCLGDSGGPMTLRVSGQTALIGVTSTGTKTDCSEGDNSYFTNLQDPSVASFVRSVAPAARFM